MLLTVQAYLQPANQCPAGHMQLIHLNLAQGSHHKNARSCYKKLQDRNVPHIFHHEKQFFLFEILCFPEVASLQWIADYKNPSDISEYHLSLQWHYNPAYLFLKKEMPDNYH